MQGSRPPQPRRVLQVMVSSTFTDLRQHRASLIDAIHAHKLHANVMEHDSARLIDVIDSSLQMVRDSAAYIGVVGLKYGQTPECPERNPDRLSITELEFNEAQRIGRPILLYVMGDEHYVKKADIEVDPDKEKKLNAFRERAKKSSPGSGVNRVYAVFDSLQEFKDKLGSSLAELYRHLESADLHGEKEDPPAAFHAVPDYIGRDKFIGRKAQLKTLSDWAKPSDPTNVVLFEAIGGNGKSMLTWEWATNHAPVVRSDWAGRFWYSFYEKGAVMHQFCQHALAYMLGQPLEAFEKRKTADLREELVAQLRRRPWLLVLDGLERVLVAYHRIDAAQVPDEQANAPTDKVLDRDPRDAIRDGDNDLLRALATATPSKILISSRLIPRALLNNSGLPLPGVKPLTLPGLDVADAEELLRSCGVRGTSSDIRYYLTKYCGNHPLLITILGGLVNSPGPHRGDFDSWAADPEQGAKLNLATLDLIQSRNHILRAALDALDPASHQLLSSLSLISSAVDYETVAALNPHLPPKPEMVEEPSKPEEDWHMSAEGPSPWHELSRKDQARVRARYEADLARRKVFEQAMQAWSKTAREAMKRLPETVQDLERRGLLQYDARKRRYDLHPVVRGMAAGGMKVQERERYGQRVLDFFSSVAHNPYDAAKTLEDLRTGLDLVQTLLLLGRLQQAADSYVGILCTPLLRMEHDEEVIAVTRPFFQNGWSELPSQINHSQAVHLMQDASIALVQLGRSDIAMGCYSALIVEHLKSEDWDGLSTELEWLAECNSRSRLATNERLYRYGFELAELSNAQHAKYRLLRASADLLSKMGRYRESEVLWEQLFSLPEPTIGHDMVVADTAALHAEHLQRTGRLTDELFARAEHLAEKAGYDRTRRRLHRQRGFWWLEQGRWDLAAVCFDQAITLARERRLVDEGAVTGLALAKLKSSRLSGDDARGEAEYLARQPNPAHYTLATLWQAIGEIEQATLHALKAYEAAWADGEPYVYRSKLVKSTALLNELGVPTPELQAHNPAMDTPYPWEGDVRAAIGWLRAQRSD